MGAPKSAYELAMERLRKKDEEAGLAQATVTDDQKAEIADVRSTYAARLAQEEIMQQAALIGTFDPAEREASSSASNSMEYRPPASVLVFFHSPTIVGPVS